MKQQSRGILERWGDFRGEFPRKLIITGISAILLALLYSIIFSFSAQDAEQSGSLSLKISYKGAELIDFFSGGARSEAALTNLAEILEHPIRKLAHFSEYGCLGVLAAILWSQWMRPGKKRFLFVTGWVFVSAALDEFHQYFVPGRWASIADVALDTCGGVCGMLVCMALAALYRKRKRRRRTQPSERMITE